MTSSSAVNPEKSVNWPLVMSLVGLNAAIIISWIAYHNYQPKLLERFGFELLDDVLGYAKLLVMGTVPPLAGLLADRMRKDRANSLPLVSAGVGITALIFMTVAATISPEALIPLRDFLPVMIVLWLISMNLFFAPALATLEQFVPAAQFTAVMGVFILVSDLVYALEPAVILLIDFIGASLTFVTGGVLIGVSGYVFARKFRTWSENQPEAEGEYEGHSKLLNVLLIALALGFVISFLLNVMPTIANNKLMQVGSSMRVEILLSGLLAATAITAFFISRRKMTQSRENIYLRSFLGSLLTLALATFLPGWMALVCLLGLVFFLATMSVNAFPMAIVNIKPQEKMLAAGIFIAGLEVPDSLLELVI